MYNSNTTTNTTTRMHDWRDLAGVVAAQAEAARRDVEARVCREACQNIMFLLSWWWWLLLLLLLL